MNINIEEKIGARFKLVASKADGRITKETGWFDNIVLDSGIDRMLSSTWGDGVAVGSGSSTPQKTQTQLDSVIATTTTRISGTSGAQTTTEPFYEWVRYIYRFGEGIAAGNISEVGIIYRNATNLWNRALVRDTEGNPTSITILSDEFLDVVVEVRHMLQSKFTSSVPYLNKQGVKIRDIPIVISPYYSSNSSSSMSQITSTSYALYSGTSNPDLPTSLPSNSLGSTSVGLSTKISANSFRSVFKASLTQGNGSIKSMIFRISGLVGGLTTSSGYKVELETPIDKTAEMELTFTISVTLTST